MIDGGKGKGKGKRATSKSEAVQDPGMIGFHMSYRESKHFHVSKSRTYHWKRVRGHNPQYA